MIEEIRKALESFNGTWKEKKGLWEFSSLIAERKAFLTRKRLLYSAKMRIDDDSKMVKFSEMLMEEKSGLTAGGSYDDDGISPGFGFKTETYNTFKGVREGNIEEQSNFFGIKYEYKFNYKEIRSKAEVSVKSAGYRFEYQILPIK
jgi:hypothetical protein